MENEREGFQVEGEEERGGVGCSVTTLTQADRSARSF